MGRWVGAWTPSRVSHGHFTRAVRNHWRALGGGLASPAVCDRERICWSRAAQGAASLDREVEVAETIGPLMPWGPESQEVTQAVSKHLGRRLGQGGGRLVVGEGLAGGGCARLERPVDILRLWSGHV